MDLRTNCHNPCFNQLGFDQCLVIYVFLAFSSHLNLRHWAVTIGSAVYGV